MKSVLNLIFVVLCLPALQAQSHHSDCSDARLLCSTSTVEIQSFNGRGEVRNEVGPTDCYNGLFPENNGIWLQWEIGTPGELAFTITPKQAGDDLDFVLFQMRDQTFNCSTKQSIRCAVSGENQGRDPSSYSICMGATGLRSSSTDFAEKRGCFGDDDNFVAPVSAQAGETFLLYINNYASSKGFTLEFTGDAGFTAYTADDIVSNTDAIIAKQTVEFSTPVLVSFLAADHQWDFGQDATPSTASGVGPHQVTFNKAGQHYVSHTVKVDQGCSTSTTQLFEVVELVQAPAATVVSAVSDVQIGKVFPNPSADQAFIEINTPVSRTATILITDELGREVSRTEYKLYAGQQQLTLDLGKLEYTQTLFVNIQLDKEQFHRKLLYLRP